jgi:hypothetical protein
MKPSEANGNGLDNENWEKNPSKIIFIRLRTEWSSIKFLLFNFYVNCMINFSINVGSQQFRLFHPRRLMIHWTLFRYIGWFLF